VWFRRISLIYCRIRSGRILGNLVVTVVVVIAVIVAIAVIVVIAVIVGIALIVEIALNCIYAKAQGYVFTTRKQLGGQDNFQKESYNRHKKSAECLDTLATCKGARRRQMSITRWK
jgi:hypothetical protein